MKSSGRFKGSPDILKRSENGLSDHKVSHELRPTADQVSSTCDENQKNQQKILVQNVDYALDDTNEFMEGKVMANYILKSNLSSTFYPKTSNSLSTNIHSESFSTAFQEQCKSMSSEAQEVIKST